MNNTIDRIISNLTLRLKKAHKKNYRLRQAHKRIIQSVEKYDNLTPWNCAEISRASLSSVSNISINDFMT